MPKINKYLSHILLIIFLPNWAFSQFIGSMQFKEFPILQNLDSLEKAVSMDKTNPEKYLIGLLTLEKSREMIKSYKFGNSLPLVDSLLKIRPFTNIRATYLYLLGIDVNSKEELNEASLRYTTTALGLFENLKDTSGIVNCLKTMVQLNISNYGDIKGDLTAAERYLGRLTVLANSSSNIEDQLTELFARQVFYYAQVVVPAPKPADLAANKAVSLKAISLINQYPQYAYWKPKFLNFYANLFFLEKNYRKSADLHIQCLNLITSNESNYSIKFNFNLGNDYGALKEFKKAENCYLDAVAKQQSAKTSTIQEMSILENLSKVQFLLKEYDSAWINTERYVSLKDTVNNQTKTKTFLDLQTKYETDKKEQANRALQKEKHQYQLAILFGILLVLTISILLFYLSRKNKQLDESAHFRDQIIFVMSHDLKSPVSALAGIGKKVGYFIRKGEMENLEMVGQSIDASIFQVNLLINNLLLWAISDDVNIARKMQKFALLSVVNDIVSLYSAVASEKNAAIKIDVPEDMVVYGNKNGISIIVRNLLDNALKHSASKKITIAAIKKNDCIVIQITNDSAKLSDQILERIKAQLKGSTSNEMNTATALGLRLVAYFAKIHKASVAVKSNLNEGTVFTVTLPQ